MALLLCKTIFHITIFERERVTQHPGSLLRESETGETLQGKARSGSALARGKEPDDA